MSYSDGYRDGALAERRRAILIALRGVNMKGKPCDRSYAIAQAIGYAKDILPVDKPIPGYTYNHFGQCHLREVPTILEAEESPFTKMGRRYINTLENTVAEMCKDQGKFYRTRIARKVQAISTKDNKIKELQQALHEQRATTKELRDLVEFIR